jgi:hypothetical protein
VVYIEVAMNTMTRSGIRYAADYPKSTAQYEVLAWCRHQYGEPGFLERWMALDWTIQFRDKRDRDWFFLRWGQ